MQRQIYLHGYLSEHHSGALNVEAASVAEALRVLTQVLPAGDPVPVRIEGLDSDTALYSRNNPMTEIHIYPEDRGSGGRAGIGQILIGAVLIGLAFATAGAGGIFMGSMFGVSTSTMAMTGAMMALGGIIQMLTPVPETGGDQQTSSYTSVNENTAAIGTPIPIVFGTARVDGHILSLDVDAIEVEPGQDLEFDGGTFAAAHEKIGESTYYFPIDEMLSPPAKAVLRPVYASPGAAPTEATGYAS